MKTNRINLLLQLGAREQVVNFFDKKYEATEHEVRGELYIREKFNKQNHDHLEYSNKFSTCFQKILS